MRRRKQKKQRKIIVMFMVGILCIMTAGYAAFQTNLNISAKGNIKEMSAADQLKKDVITSGDGIYKDVNEEDKFIYKGANPNNYIEFNNELWRIVSIESDDTLKIMRKDSIGNMAFDTSNSNNWARPATLNTYLNDENDVNSYYNSLSGEAKALIQTHDFAIGAVTPVNKDLFMQIQAENGTMWKGKIGLLTAGDVVRANSNISLCGTLGSHHTNQATCKTTNYIVPVTGFLYTISSSDENSDDVFATSYAGYIGRDDATNIGGVYPTLYLKSNVKLSGEGTSTNPYTIN